MTPSKTVAGEPVAELVADLRELAHYLSQGGDHADEIGTCNRAVATLASMQEERDEARRERDEARENAWPFGKRPNPVTGMNSGDFAVYGDEKSIKRVRAAMHELDAMMPARIDRIKQEMARASSLETALQDAKAEGERLRNPTQEMLDAFQSAFTRQLHLRHQCRHKPFEQLTDNQKRSAEEAGLLAMLECAARAALTPAGGQDGE